MPRVPTRKVRFKEGKFKGQVMTIDAKDFDGKLHEDASAPLQDPPSAKEQDSGGKAKK